MTKLEQVARALATEDDEEFGSNAWEAYLPMARAALEAMREPNDEMTLVGGAAIDHPTVFMGGPSRSGQRRAKVAYSAMIDAALSERPDA